MVLVSMRMIFRTWEMSIISVGVVDEVDGGDFADLRGGLHGDDVLAAAGLEAVGVDVGAPAEAVLGDVRMRQGWGRAACRRRDVNW